MMWSKKQFSLVFCFLTTSNMASSSGGLAAAAAANAFSFQDVTESVLPPYTQQAPAFLDFLKTPIAAGVCTLDADGDGHPDLYFVSGQGFPNALMRNTGNGVFDDVTDEWNLRYIDNSAVSCLSADFDNDGCDDLVLTGAYTGGNFTGNVLLRNTFCDNNDDGSAAGFSDETPDILRQWPYSVSSSAADFDNDGLLDIFVSSLPALDLSNYPGPVPLENFPGSSLLLRNTGNFVFHDVTNGSGVANPTCPCMSVTLDYNDDGFQDIIAINCGNDVIRTFSMQLYRNNGDFTFTDVSDESGFGPDDPRGMWMGAAMGDFNGDGCLDLASTNLATDLLWPDSEHHVFLGRCGDGPAGFDGEAVTILPPSENNTDDLTLFAWGPVARDFNNDGRLDMFYTGNYLVTELLRDPSLYSTEEVLALRKARFSPGQVLSGRNPEEADYQSYKFQSELLPTDLSTDFNIIMTSGDFNGDGAVDIVIAVDGFVPGPRSGRPAIFYGTPNGNNWLGVRLVGTSAGVSRQAIGAIVQLYQNGAVPAKQTLVMSAGSASMSTEEKTLFFGLGANAIREFKVEVTWPGGVVETFGGFTENKVVTLVQGSGDGDGNSTCHERFDCTSSFGLLISSFKYGSTMHLDFFGIICISFCVTSIFDSFWLWTSLMKCGGC